VLIALARVLGDKPEGPLGFRRLMVSLAMVMVPVGLVFVEPDLGTSLSFVIIWITMVLVAGIRWRHALLLLVASILAAPLVWLSMKDYMRERLVTFIGTLVDLEHAAFDQGYNVLRRASARLGRTAWPEAIEGTQSQLVPAHHQSTSSFRRPPKNRGSSAPRRCSVCSWSCLSE
jgi:rod shape determining protein RodA